MSFLFDETGQMVARWVHFFAGVIWIGHLYYFNFVQGPFFAEVDANVKNVAIAKLVPRALWWFRYGALFTWLAGFYMLSARGHMATQTADGANMQGFFDLFFGTSWGTYILLGSLLGTLMFLNVWLIIWPNQKVVIQSATQVLGGGQPIAQAAACGARAGLASRHNVLFSIPMLLFMGLASHLSFGVTATSLWPLWGTVLVIVGALQFNAMKGKMGPLATVKGVITSGFVLSFILFAVVRLLA